MSDTITEAAELLHVDPASLTIGTNVRVDTRPDAKEFAKSIHERGVLEVITAYRDDDGSLVVHRGQRRTVVATQPKSSTASSSWRSSVSAPRRSPSGSPSSAALSTPPWSLPTARPHALRWPASN